MVSRIDRLYETFTSLPRETVRRLLDKWDRDQGQAMFSAERSLRKPPCKYQWSPALRNAGLVRQYWKLRLKDAMTGSDHHPRILTLAEQIRQYESEFKFPYQDVPLSSKEIRSHLNSASRALRILQRGADHNRERTLYDLLALYESPASPLSATESKRRSAIIRRTLRSEQSKAIHAHVRSQLNDNAKTGIQFVNVPADCIADPSSSYAHLSNNDPSTIIWEKVIDQQQIEQHILHYNQHSFRAAASSPCGNGLIYDELSFTSLSSAASELLQGVIPPHWCHTDYTLSQFLASFAVPESVLLSTPISTSVSTSDVTRGFKGWRESTSTSPSGRHLGHYKAILTDPVLLSCLTKFLHIALNSGIAITRWRKAINVMLEKDPGVPNLNRLRIIHLFEADYNFLLKLMWGHRLVRRAVDQDLLHKSQHGSVPRHTTMDAVMQTQLTTDLCRVMKHNLARFDNDASACYDRIIVPLAMLAARRCGMPDEAILFHSEALQHMEYSVQTVHGVSSESYQGTTTTPLFGTGQGSGASPAAWLSLGVLLMKTMDSLVPDRISFSSTDSGLAHSRLMDAFVDDTYIGFSDHGIYKSAAAMISRLQEISQHWERLLSLSGGALNLSKCGWYLMYWTWKNGRPILQPPSPTDPGITLTSGFESQKRHSIHRAPLTQSTRMLGVHLNPLGDFSQHLQIMKKKADNFAIKLRSPKLRASDVRLFHRTVYIPSMCYSLPAIAANEEELSQVQSKVLPALLNGMGVSSKLHTAIRHGPISMGGMALLDLRTEIGIAQIRLLRDSIFSMSEVGKLILLSLTSSQLESGSGSPLLEEPHHSFDYITPTWVLSVRQFLFQHNMSITITKSREPFLQRKHDEFIMQPTLLRRYTAQQRLDLNLVRLHLQVSTLADLSAGSDGRTICPLMARGQRPPEFKSQSHWPRQEAPTVYQKRLWHDYVASSFLRYQHFWTRPLGPMIPPPHRFPDPLTTQRPIQSFDSLRSYLKAIPSFYRRLLSHHRQVASDLEVWRSFRSRRRLEIATDGSLAHSVGTFGWRIVSPPDLVLFEGSGPIDGPEELSSSTRSELGGFAAPLLLVVAIARFWGLPHSCKFRWIADSTSAISKVEVVTKRDFVPYRQPNNVDFLSLITFLTHELRRPLSTTWVKSHQDSGALDLSALTRDAQNNIAVDKLATDHRIDRSLPPSSTLPHLSHMGVSIVIDGRRLTGHFDATIRYHINGYHLRLRMQNKFGWSDKVWHEIDHHRFGQHFRSLPPTQQVRRMKFVHNCQPLGVLKAARAPIKSPSLSLCPCCLSVDETQIHFLRCSENPNHRMALRTLQKQLHSTDRHAIFYLVAQCIILWLADSPVIWSESDLRGYPSHMHDMITDMMTSQISIGWLSLIKGFLSLKWTVLAACPMDPKDRHVLGNPAQADGRLRLIYKSVHEFSEALWKGRNEKLHGNDRQDKIRFSTAESLEIQHYHSQPELIPEGDRHYCSKSLQQLLSSTPSVRRRWLRQVKLARTRQISHGSRQQVLTQFFQYMPPTQELPTLHPRVLPPPAPPPTQTLISRFFTFNRKPNSTP
jgi:hypothetical protein